MEKPMNIIGNCRNQMKHILWILMVSAFITSSAEANMRAPVTEDGDVVIAKLALEATKSITLTKQQLVMTLPRLVVKEFSSLQAEIQATYTFRNDGPAVSVPIVFLATEIHNATVTINGKQASAPKIGEMNDAQLVELVKAADINELPRRMGIVSGTTATFDLMLEPGDNTVAFKYGQNTRFDERDMRGGGTITAKWR